MEIVVGLRLTPNTVEQFTFEVPRTRLNYFQDDIYPSTLCVEESALTAGQWLQGENGQQRFLNLKPPNMKSCMFQNNARKLALPLLYSPYELEER